MQPLAQSILNAGLHKAFADGGGEHKNEEDQDNLLRGLHALLKGVAKVDLGGQHIDHNGGKGGNGCCDQQIELKNQNQTGKQNQREEFQNRNKRVDVCSTFVLRSVLLFHGDGCLSVIESR